MPIAVFGIIALWAGLFSTDFQPSLFFEPKKIIEALTLPTTLFALCIPFTVAISRFHISAQKDKANKDAEAVKSFRHYFEHREAFTKYMSNNRTGLFYGVIIVKEPLKIYEMLFPNSSVVNFSLERTDKTDDIIIIAFNRLISNLEEDDMFSVTTPLGSEVISEFRLHYLNEFGITCDFSKSTDRHFHSTYKADFTEALIANLLLILQHAQDFNRTEQLISNNTLSKINESRKIAFPKLNERLKLDVTKLYQILAPEKPTNKTGLIRRVRVIIKRFRVKLKR
jgi:hypothetical protein